MEADADLIARHVVDAVRDRLAHRLAREVAPLHVFGSLRRVPLPPRILEIAHQLLFVSTEMTGWPCCRNVVAVPLMCSNCALRSECCGPFAGLPGGSAALQQATDRRRTHAPAVGRQHRRQLRATLARPAQGRGRIASRERIHQPLQRWSAGLVLLQAWLPGPGTANPSGRWGTLGRLAATFRMVSRASPVAEETSASPPYPTAIDSAAAPRRRARSSSSGDIAANLATIEASRSSSRVTQTLDYIHSHESKVILGKGL